MGSQGSLALGLAPLSGIYAMALVTNSHQCHACCTCDILEKMNATLTLMAFPVPECIRASKASSCSLAVSYVRPYILTSHIIAEPLNTSPRNGGLLQEQCAVAYQSISRVVFQQNRQCVRIC